MAVVIVTIATVLFVSIRQSQQVRDNALTVSRTEDVLRHIQNLELAVADNETFARSYVIAGKNEYLHSIDKAEKEIRAELRVLGQMVQQDSIARSLLLDSLSPYIDKRIAFSKAVVVVRQTQGSGAAADFLISDSGKSYTQEIRHFADKVQARESQLLELRKRKNDKNIKKLSTTLYIVLAAVFILSMLIIRKVRSDVRFIIQRRKREEELHKSEERFSLLVSNVKDYAIYMIDADGKVSSWNSGAEYIKGYKAEEIIGKPIDIFYTPEAIAAGEPIRNLELAKQQGSFQKEVQRLRKDGSLFWAHIVITPLFDNEARLHGYAKITRDITERKNNEEQLRLLSRQLNQANDAIYMVNSHKQVISWNKGAEKLYGFTQEEALGKNPNQLLQSTISKEEIDQALTKLSLDNYWVGEFKRTSKTGGEIYLRCSISTIRDDSGTIMGYISVNIDITERKILEDKLKEFNEDLEQQVKQKTAELTGIFERVTDAFIALDKDFRYRYINEKAGELIQRVPASLVGKKVLDEYPYLIDSELFKGMTHAMEVQQQVIVTEDYPELGLILENYIYPSPNGVSIFIRDITLQKKTESKLKTAHDRLLFHVENAPLGFIEWDSELKVLSWSKRAEEIFGWSENEVMRAQKNGIHKGYHEDMPMLKEAVRQLLESGLDRNSVVHRNYTKSGNVIWCEWFNSVIKDNNGKVITILSLVQDITERKNAEEQIRKNFSEKQSLAERMSTILNTLPANIALLNEQGVIVDVGESWKNFSSGNGLINNDYRIGTDYVAKVQHVQESGGKDGSAVAEGIRSVLSGELNDFSFEYQHESGGDKWFRLVVTPLQQQVRSGVVLMHIDITGQKLSEEELRRSEQKYKLLFESNPMPMWMRSIDDMEIIDVNKAACMAYGYSKEEFTQLAHADLRHPDELDAFINEFQFDIPHPVNRGVWKHRKKDQTFIDVEIFAQDIIYNHKKVRLILAKDVTERLKAEEQLNNSYQEIRKLASYLQNIREEERKNMAREIHDQLGQQLTVMKMDISWLDKKVGSTDKIIHDKMNELSNITDDTINLVRRIASDLRPGLLDDMGMIAAIEWQLEDFQKRSGVISKLNSMNEEPALGPAAKTNLFRIVQESLTNIARYANANEVVVTIGEQDGQLILSIQDDGVGFDQEKIASVKTLGILGMRERTAMMGGTYAIHSAPGKGTRVLVTVPLFGEH